MLKKLILNLLAETIDVLKILNLSIKKYFKILLCSLVCLSAGSCQKYCDEFAPPVTFFPNPCLIQSRPSAFTPLDGEERQKDWGKELRIAYAFAQEQDYYRAITSFKRALVLLPANEKARKEQTLYAIFQSYYLAYKYQEAIEAFEGTGLENVPRNFPAFKELLISLYDCYEKTDQVDKACKLMSLIEKELPEEAAALRLSTAFLRADFPAISEAAALTRWQEDVDSFTFEYHLAAKSPEKARLYQTILPGAGYYYVGLKNTALTSFMLNSLFIWATYSCFKNGNVAAGLLTLSLETGWYFGGINGAGIAAREYNERLYEVNGGEFLRSRGLFPILMIGTSF